MANPNINQVSELQATLGDLVNISQERHGFAGREAALDQDYLDHRGQTNSLSPQGQMMGGMLSEATLEIRVKELVEFLEKIMPELLDAAEALGADPKQMAIDAAKYFTLQMIDRDRAEAGMPTLRG